MERNDILLLLITGMMTRSASRFSKSVTPADLTFIGPRIANIFSEYNQQDATFLKFIYFCKTLYMFQTVFPSIIRSSKLHIQRQAFVRPLLLPAATLARLAAGSSNGLYVQFCAPDDGRKNRLKHVERLT